MLRAPPAMPVQDAGAEGASRTAGWISALPYGTNQNLRVGWLSYRIILSVVLRLSRPKLSGAQPQIRFRPNASCSFWPIFSW